MKKILFFSNSMNIGGMEKALLFLLNALCNKGYDITLVLEDKTGPLLQELNPNIKVREYHLCKSKILYFRKAFNFVHRFFWSLKYCRKYDFSCNYATYSTIGSRLALIASKNTALYVHSDYWNYFKGNKEEVSEFFVQQGINTFKNILFVSNESMESIRKIFPEFSSKFFVISNLVDYADIENKACETIAEAKDEQKEVILFVGRMEENSKRLTRLIETFSLVSKSSNDFEFWILGDGSDRDLCLNLIYEKGIGNTVKVLGEKINPYPYIKGADCVILCSDFEGYPVVYNECAVLGTPMVTTVPVSDSFFNVADFAVLVEKDPEQISRVLLNKVYKKIPLKKLDFEKINQERLKMLEKIF
ncbi:MAG: glycosyltransferase [Clostridia bacterium]|nr:glycosyltransferase [Clostridia bacterium]